MILPKMVKPHRVPQSVFDVDFKLFDFMTMKQFVIVMVTAVIAAMFYFLLDKITSPFLKWFVVLLISTVGLIISFVKVQGEPFEVYVTNFVLALVSPQRRVWQKSGEMPAYLREAQRKTSAKEAAELQKKLKKQTTQPKFDERLLAKQFDKPQQKKTKLDIIEESYLKGQLPVYGAIEAPPPTQDGIEHGIIWGSVRSQEGTYIEGATVTVEDQSDKPVAKLITDKMGQFRAGAKLQPGVYSVSVIYPGMKFSTLDVAVEDKALEPLIITPKTHQQPTTQIPAPVPAQPPAQPPQVQTMPIESLANANELMAKNVTQPNLFAGEVVDQAGKPLEQVIITIKEENGSTIKSLATNPLGQFFSQGPLQNSRYVVE